MITEEKKYLNKCLDQTSSSLRKDIMPFWMEHGLDRKNGGVFTALDRDGTLMDSTKSVWFQGRFGYVAALAYLHDPFHSQWLEASKSCIDFIEEHCFDTDGHMFFEVTAEGKPLRKRRYVFSECFAIMAMAEYSLASGDKSYARKALDLFKRTLNLLSSGILENKFLFSARGHSITMMLINVAVVLKQVSDDPALDIRIDQSIEELRKYFMKEEFGTLLEMVGPDGELIDTCNGRTINPGHCIETGWFILKVAELRAWDESLVKMGTTIIDWAWKWGWDDTYGGIINFRDCKGFPPQDYSQDMKFWWPQCEAILASLMAWRATGQEKYLDMHRKAYDYAFSKFPDPEFGEWFGYLHRDGTPAQTAKGNLFKGPFHIPRMMLLSEEMYRDILSDYKE